MLRVREMVVVFVVVVMVFGVPGRLAMRLLLLLLDFFLPPFSPTAFLDWSSFRPFILGVEGRGYETYETIL